jgi:hypothetical protein
MLTPSWIVPLPPKPSQEPAEPSPHRRAARWIAEGLVAAAGLLLIAIAVFIINDDWVDRHFLPDFFKSRAVYHTREAVARIVLAGTGLAMLLVIRRAAGRLAARGTLKGFLQSGLPILLSLALSLVASEMVLRTTYWHVAAEAPLSPEPKLQPDTRLGWTFAPSRTSHGELAGRTVDYTFDAAGYRVRAPGETPDLARPTIVFAGESVIAGVGLTWQESIPAQVEAMTGVQSANIAVVGYATDQVLMRLTSELPRFQRPSAVVVLFTPMLLAKNLTDDRPHLRPDLSWAPGKTPLRLEAIAVHALPYHGRGQIDASVAMTSAALKAIVDQTHARGAQALIVTPQFGPEEPAARALRRRILDDTGLPYVFVPLDPAWRLRGDAHPDARGAKAIAAAIAARLRAPGAGGAP